MVEKIFEAWTEEVNDEDVVEAFLAEVVYVGDARCDTIQVSRLAGNAWR